MGREHHVVQLSFCGTSVVLLPMKCSLSAEVMQHEVMRSSEVALGAKMLTEQAGPGSVGTEEPPRQDLLVTLLIADAS